MTGATDPDLALPPLREVIAAHGLRAEKSLGQNFLLDRNITDKIARSAGDLSSGTVFEIGPGPGGLTRSLLKAGAKRVVAVEFDPRAVEALRGLEEWAQGHLTVVQGDALDVDLVSLAPDSPRRIVANLPYNIATPLLVGWLRQIRADSTAFTSMTLMFQKEVALRLCAPPGSKTFGRLSVLAQWLCEVRRAFDLPPSVFVPAPKVTSSVVQFTPRSLPPKAPAFETVEKLTAAAFGQRRKMLRSALKDYPGLLESCGIEPSLRAEQLAVDDFIRMAERLDQNLPAQ